MTLHNHKYKIKSVTKGESLTMRMSPRIRWALELLSRQQRRTLSAVIEFYIIANAHELTDKTWDIDPITRIKKLKEYCPQFMTFEEEELLKELNHEI